MMSGLLPFDLSPEETQSLRGRLMRLPEVILFSDELQLASLVAALGMRREFGTLNDEMARFVFDAVTGKPIPYPELRSELVRLPRPKPNGDVIGVRVWAPGHPSLELRFRGIRELLHPRFSFREDGTLYQCVFFPESIARILALQDTELVLVRPWAMNTIFGGFDPAKNYYQTNFWELENNDALRFARLLTRRQVPFLGTHDLVAHIAGVRAGAWKNLAQKATEVHDTLAEYLHKIKVPTISSLVIPYTIGVLLDDLAQPPNYDAPGRHLVINEGLRVLRERAIDPGQTRMLLKFPLAYEKTIRLARDGDAARIRREARPTMDEMVAEIQAQSASV